MLPVSNIVDVTDRYHFLYHEPARSFPDLTNEAQRTPEHQPSSRIRRGVQQAGAAPCRLPRSPSRRRSPATSPTGMSSPDTSRRSKRSTFARASSGFIQRVAFHRGRHRRAGRRARHDRPATLRGRRRARRGGARAGEDARAAGPAGARARQAAREHAGDLARGARCAHERASPKAPPRCARAEAALRTAKLNLEWTVVRAPISGRVGRAEITAGNLVQAGAAVAVAADDDRLARSASTSTSTPTSTRTSSTSARRRALRGGNCTLDPGRPRRTRPGFRTRRSSTSSTTASTASAGTIRVRAVLRNPNHQLHARACSRASGSPAISAAPATMVQDQAIGTDQDRKFVLVLKPDSTSSIGRSSSAASSTGCASCRPDSSPAKTS